MSVWNHIDKLAGATPDIEDTERWRGRFVAALALAGSSASLIMCLAFLLAGDWPAALVAPFGAFFCLGLVFAWRRTRNIEMIANAFGTFASVLYFAGFIIHREMSMVAWLAITPLLVLFLGGRRMGLMWVGIDAVLMVLAVGVTRMMPTLKLPVELGFEPALIRMLSLMVVVFVLGLLSDLSANSVLLKLRKASDEARAASDAKTRFLANVSHELRTPLNGVIGMAELMSHNELTAAQRERLAVVLQSGQLLRLLIDDVLDLTQLEKGLLQINEGPVMPHEVALTVVKQLQSLADAKGLALGLECHGERAAMSTDALRLMQVLSNLVGNALKFTKSGGVTVVVTVRREGPKDVRLVLEVRDTGPGIAEADLEKLFTPFTRLQNATAVPGAGLGLSIVKSICGLLGGQISAQSQLGIGSNFRFELIRPWTAQIVTLEPALTQRPARVLLVDDNAVNLKVSKGLLEKLGCEVITACDGQDAVNRFESHRFDLVLMDLHMPVMDGFQSAKIIRERDADVSIIALTASTVREELDAVIGAGMNGHLNKPVRMVQLRDALPAKLIERQPGRRTG